jgi:hypothetical protein
MKSTKATYFSVNCTQNVLLHWLLSNLQLISFGPLLILLCNNLLVFVAIFVKLKVSYSWCNQKMTSFRGQASWAKMTLPVGKLTALACHLTKRINKAEEVTYIFTNIGLWRPVTSYLALVLDLSHHAYCCYAACHHDECCFVECHYDECHGTPKSRSIL